MRLRELSPARTSIKILLAILALTLPVLVLLSATPEHAGVVAVRTAGGAVIDATRGRSERNADSHRNSYGYPHQHTRSDANAKSNDPRQEPQ